MKLSIIIPIYNVAPYLRKCVDSLLAQDISDYEIILVDDGSTDNSGAICDEYTSPSFVNSLTRSVVIKVIHQPNAGLSAARNSGVKIANGDYLMFVDSDDFIEPNVLGGLMAQVERDDLDVLRFNYQNVNERYEVFSPNKAQKRDVDYSETVTDGETFLNERLGPMCYAVMFILRRDLIIVDGTFNPLIPSSSNPPNNVLFTEKIYFEDTDWTPRMLLRAKRIASTPMVVYNYLWRTGSITLPTDSAKRMKILEDKIRLIRGFQEQSKLVKDPIWFRWMETNTVMTILSTIAMLPVDSRKLYIKELKALHVFPLMTKREKMWTHRLKIHLANLSPALYCFIMSLRK